MVGNIIKIGVIVFVKITFCSSEYNSRKKTYASYFSMIFTFFYEFSLKKKNVVQTCGLLTSF